MKPFLIAMLIAGAIAFHMGLLCLFIWLMSVAPMLGLALLLFWIAGWLILTSAYISKL